MTSTHELDSELPRKLPPDDSQLFSKDSTHENDEQTSYGFEQRKRLARLSKASTSGFMQQQYHKEPMEGKASNSQLWLAPDRLPSRGSSCASTDTDELEEVREVLRQRRLSRQTNQSTPPGESYSGIKALRLAVQEHELPMRMAYKQLDELAANAERVKASIERNRSLLLLQVKKSNSRYSRTAFTWWRLYTQEKVRCRRMLQHTKILLTQGLLARSFKSWCSHILRHGKFKRFQRSVEHVLQRHLLQRIWKAWIDHVKQRVKKEEDHRREKRLLKDMDDRLKERLVRRASNFMHRKRLERAFLAFQEGCHLMKTKKYHESKLFQIMSKKKMSRIFNMWKQLKELHLFYKRAVRKLVNRFLGACFRAWREKAFHIENCTRKIARRRLALVFSSWAKILKNTERKKEMESKIKRKRLVWYFNGLMNGCKQRRWRQCFKKKVMQKALGRKLRMVFQAWLCFMQVQDQKKMTKLQDYVAVIEKENERSRSECGRLARIVETGEWGKQQLSEIIQAKEVLAEEREALTKLIGSLQQQQIVVFEQQQKNEDNIRNLKDQILGNNFMYRNKMMIKGASSFNTVVRAVKSDALKRGVHPEFLYAMDRLAMDKVCIFPDGEIRVKTLHNFDKGKWISRNSKGAIGSIPNVKSSSVNPLAVQASPRPTSPTLYSNSPYLQEHLDTSSSKATELGLLD